MSDATTPADPTDQIAATPAVLSPEPPIVPTAGTKHVPDDSETAVVQDAQRWRNDLQRVYEGDFGSESKSFKRLAAHIERLEADNRHLFYYQLFVESCDLECDFDDYLDIVNPTHKGADGE